MSDHSNDITIHGYPPPDDHHRLSEDVELWHALVHDLEANATADAENIQALADEIQRLRAALEAIGGLRDPYLESEDEIAAFARAALAEEGKTE